MMIARKKRIAVLKKWAEALRSGKYRQADSCLRKNTTNKMCCLGVLCDVVEPTGWDKHGHHHGQTSYPRREVQQLAGLRLDHGEFVDDDSEFAELNDSKNATFDEIADVVDWMRYDLESRK